MAEIFAAQPSAADSDSRVCFWAADLLWGDSLATMLRARLMNPAQNSEILDTCRDPILRSNCFIALDDFLLRLFRADNGLRFGNGRCA